MNGSWGKQPPRSKLKSTVLKCEMVTNNKNSYPFCVPLQASEGASGVNRGCNTGFYSYQTLLRLQYRTWARLIGRGTAIDVLRERSPRSAVEGARARKSVSAAVVVLSARAREAKHWYICT